MDKDEFELQTINIFYLRQSIDNDECKCISMVTNRNTLKWIDKDAETKLINLFLPIGITFSSERIERDRNWLGSIHFLFVTDNRKI